MCFSHFHGTLKLDAVHSFEVFVVNKLRGLTQQKRDIFNNPFLSDNFCSVIRCYMTGIS